MFGEGFLGVNHVALKEREKTKLEEKGVYGFSGKENLVLTRSSFSQFVSKCKIGPLSYIDYNTNQEAQAFAPVPVKLILRFVVIRVTKTGYKDEGCNLDLRVSVSLSKEHYGMKLTLR